MNKQRQVMRTSVQCKISAVFQIVMGVQLLIDLSVGIANQIGRPTYERGKRVDPSPDIARCIFFLEIWICPAACQWIDLRPLARGLL